MHMRTRLCRSRLPVGAESFWRIAAPLIAAALILLAPSSGNAFSVLAHQAAVDQVWTDRLVPLIRQRFPNATQQELDGARAYARGGSHLPDLGYFPLGNRQFTDLLHYVRTGDFVSRLLAEAGSADEYAFALGVLAHYEVDSIGHPLATNLAVPIIYPELAATYGDTMTYADSPSAHLQTEFRFDVLQVARRGEVPDLFEHSVEFQVPKEFLQRVFKETYGLDLDDLFESFDVALTTYRWAFRTLIDEATGIAWQLYRADIQSLEPGVTRKQFLQAMPRGDFEREFGKAFLEPGYFARFVGFLGNLLPNVGPLKRLPYRPLPDRVKLLYVSGFHKAFNQNVREVAIVAKGRVQLENLNLDTGRPTRAGEYAPADKAYAELLRLHAKDNFARVPGDLAIDMLNHFRDRKAALAFEESAEDREKTLAALNALESKLREGPPNVPPPPLTKSRFLVALIAMRSTRLSSKWRETGRRRS